MVKNTIRAYLSLYLVLSGLFPAVSAWAQGPADAKKSVLAVVNLDAKGGRRSRRRLFPRNSGLISCRPSKRRNTAR